MQFVGAFCTLGLRSILLWVGELGLTHCSSRSLLKGQSMHKTSTPKERQLTIINTWVLIHKYRYTFINLKVNILWQKVYSEKAINIISAAKYKIMVSRGKWTKESPNSNLDNLTIGLSHQSCAFWRMGLDSYFLFCWGYKE